MSIEDVELSKTEWLFRTCDHMHQAVMKAEFERRGLDKASHPFILFTLHSEGGNGRLSQNRLAEILGISHPTVAISVRRMEKAGLIRKTLDETDRRKNRILLTDKGERMVSECKAAIDEIDRRMFEGFSLDDQEKLRAYYALMIKNMKAMGAQVPDGF